MRRVMDVGVSCYCWVDANCVELLCFSEMMWRRSCTTSLESGCTIMDDSESALWSSRRHVGLVPSAVSSGSSAMTTDSRTWSHVCLCPTRELSNVATTREYHTR